jgi:hypothetical protein
MAGQNPTSFTFNETEGTFRFSNEHVTIVGQTNFFERSGRTAHCGVRNVGKSRPLTWGLRTSKSLPLS